MCLYKYVLRIFKDKINLKGKKCVLKLWDRCVKRGWFDVFSFLRWKLKEYKDLEIIRREMVKLLNK